MSNRASQWVDRNEMAKAANISLRTLLNYKNSGLITAFRMAGKKRVEYNKKEILKEIGGTMSNRTVGKETPKATKATKESKAAKAVKQTTTEQRQGNEEKTKQPPPVIVTVQAPAEQPAPPAVVIIQEREQISSGELFLIEMEGLRKERADQAAEYTRKKYEKLNKEGKRWTRPPGFIDPFS